MNEIAYFETTNFPQLLMRNETCDIKFVLKDAEVKTKLFVVIYKVVYNPSDDESTTYETTFFSSSDVRYHFQAYAFPKYTAQEGFIVFANSKDDKCPLETLTPFHLTDETQILYLRSSFEENFNRKYPCNWKFTAPSEYGFKVVVEKFDIYGGTELIIQNTTNIIANTRSVKLLHPFYNTDNYIHIYLSESDQFFTTKIEFQAYISIVKKELNEVYSNCTVLRKGTASVWTTDNKNFTGYQNNFRCTLDVQIPPFHEVYVNVKYLAVEENIDKIGYYYHDENIFNPVHHRDQFMLLPFKNGYFTRNVTWEFISDGSMESLGFYIYFDEIACQCADPIIKCNEFQHYIMNMTNIYCGNLHCTYTFSECFVDTISVMVLSTGGKNLYDSLEFYSNNYSVFKIDNFNNNLDSYNVFLNAENENIIKFYSYRSSVARSIIFMTSNPNLPKITFNAILSNEESQYVLDTGDSRLSIISLSQLMISKMSQIVLLSSNSVFPSGIEIYNNESLTFNLNGQNCFDIYNPYKCHVLNTSVAIHASGANRPILVVRTTEHISGCLLNENIFLTKLLNNISVAAIASSKTKCKLIIMIEDNRVTYLITHLWTTSVKQNVEIYVGNNQTTLLFNFNAKTLMKWNDILLSAKIYTVVIPPKMAVYIRMTKQSESPSLTISLYPYQSIITTPKFETSKYNMGNSNITVRYNITKFPVQFTVLKYNIQESLWFETNGFIKNVRKIGDSVIFSNQNVTLHYVAPGYNGTKDGAMFLIQSFIRSQE